MDLVVMRRFRQSLINVDDGVRLVALALILAVLAWLIPAGIRPAAWAFLLGMIGGSVTALTNANDRRITSGREAYAEKAWMSQADLLAVGGVLGLTVTWLLLPPAYFWFVAPHFKTYHASWATLGNDLLTVLRADAVVGSIVDVPLAFLWAGILTIVYTLAYLHILGKGLAYYAALLPLIYACDVLVAHLVFHDPISQLEWFVFIPALLGLFLLRGCLKLIAPGTKPANDPSTLPTGRLSGIGARLRPLQWPSLLVVLVVGNIGLDVLARGTAYGIADPARRPFIILTYRAAYFSLFLVYAGGWWLWRVWRRWRSATSEQRPETDRRRKALALALVTAVTIACSYFLRLLAIGNNLAVGPLATSAMAIAILPLVGAWYGTEGKASSLRDRLIAAYTMEPEGIGDGIDTPSSRSWTRTASLVLFLGLMAVMAAWALTKVE